METLVVIDFETTGLSPNQGARATEVGAVKISGQKITGRYDSLMNSGTHIPSEVTELTGITNEMVDTAPPAKQVMKELERFIGSSPLVAHNASFDEKFLDREFDLAGIRRANTFACTMLLSRRIFEDMDNYKLGALAESLKLPHVGALHRALADAEMTAHLYFRISERISDDYGLNFPSHDLLRRIQKAKSSDVERILSSHAKEQNNPSPSSRPKPRPQKTTVIRCSSCGLKLRVPEEKTGKFRCPSCSNLFVTNTTHPISEPRNVEKVIIKCKSFGSSLRVPKGATGKVRCPSCQKLFEAST